ncbi:inverse autotransporter beta domain-containing protein [Candidatus Omnitrophota bacterium]
MDKRLILLVVLAITFLSVGSSYGDDGSTPEWVKRLTLGASGGEDRKPRVYFETVQPLYQDPDKERTFFIHPRYSYNDGDAAYNLGFGYRRLLNNNSILLGGNTYFDFEDDDNHYRIGFGLEAFINQIEMRANSYIGLSPVRLIEETPTSQIYEEAVDGFDGEIGLPLPHMNWIKLFAGANWYHYYKSNNQEGWSLRTEVKPFKFQTVNVILYDDNKGETSYRVDARVTIPFGVGDRNEKLSNIGISEEAYPEKADHSDKVLERVEREYDIQVEKWQNTGGIFSSIGRGT